MSERVLPIGSAVVLGAFVLILLTVSGAAQTEITLWLPWSGFDGELMTGYAEEFSAMSPDIDIEVQVVEGAGVSDGQLQVAVAGNVQPDLVLFWSQSSTAQLAAAGLIQPLDDYIERYGVRSEDYFPQAWSSGVYQGSVYAIPEMINTTLLYYNADHFVEAGLDVDAPPATTETLDVYAEALTRRLPGDRITQMGYVPWYTQASPYFWIWAFGGTPWNVEKRAPEINSESAYLAGEWQVAYVERYGLGTLEGFVEGDQFMHGTLSMMTGGEWSIRSLRTDFPEISFQTAPIPAPANGGRDRPTWLNGNVWMIPAGARHPDEAFRFLAWVNTVENSRDIGDAVFNISPLREAAISQVRLEDPDFRLSVELASSPGAVHSAPTPYGPELMSELDAAFGAARELSAPVRSLLDQAQERLEAVIRQDPR